MDRNSQLSSYELALYLTNRRKFMDEFFVLILWLRLGLVFDLVLLAI